MCSLFQKRIRHHPQVFSTLYHILGKSYFQRWHLKFFAICHIKSLLVAFIPFQKAVRVEGCYNQSAVHRNCGLIYLLPPKYLRTQKRTCDVLIGASNRVNCTILNDFNPLL